MLTSTVPVLECQTPTIIALRLPHRTCDVTTPSISHKQSRTFSKEHLVLRPTQTLLREKDNNDIMNFNFDLAETVACPYLSNSLKASAQPSTAEQLLAGPSE